MLTAAWVIYETRAVALGRQAKFFLLSEILGAVCAALCLTGTIGAIHFGNVVSHLKDVALQAYETSANKEIARAQQQAGDANKAAGIANQNAAQANLENTRLRIRLATHQIAEKKAEAELAKKNEETFNYAHALAQQQATMAQQAHVSPILTDFQIESLATELRPFSGADIIIHSTLDTTVLRLEQTIQVAFNKAGLKFTQSTMDAGALYQGVSVVVHSPQDVPPVANSLVLGLRSAGINVNTVSLDSVPAGRVALYLGPN